MPYARQRPRNPSPLVGSSGANPLSLAFQGLGGPDPGTRTLLQTGSRAPSTSPNSLGAGPPVYDPRRTFVRSPLERNLVHIGGRTYEGFDNGHANILLPNTYVANPSGVDPLERERDLARLSFMIDHPQAAGAYGFAAIAGADEGARDRVLAAAGAFDALTPIGIAAVDRARLAIPSDARPSAESPVRQDSIRYGRLGELGLPNGGWASIEKNMLGKGTRVPSRLKPPGWNAGQYDRAHLVAKWFGGSGLDSRNVTALSAKANRQIMLGFERKIARAVSKGEMIKYSSIPIYGGNGLVPTHILIVATGSRGFESKALIENTMRRNK